MYITVSKSIKITSQFRLGFLAGTCRLTGWRSWPRWPDWSSLSPPSRSVRPSSTEYQAGWVILDETIVPYAVFRIRFILTRLRIDPFRGKTDPDLFFLAGSDSLNWNGSRRIRIRNTALIVIGNSNVCGRHVYFFGYLDLKILHRKPPKVCFPQKKVSSVPLSWQLKTWGQSFLFFLLVAFSTFQGMHGITLVYG